MKGANKSKDSGIMNLMAPKVGGNAAVKQVKNTRLDTRKEVSKARAMDKRK
jgi:hypothetical protein